MMPAYVDITTAINTIAQNDDAIFFVIDSPGGTGKSTFAKKVYYYTRTQSKIVLGGAATGLATQVVLRLFYQSFLK